MPEVLVGKVRPDLKNDLTTTTEGTALDARQGKVLNDKIEDLSKDKPNKSQTYIRLNVYGHEHFNNPDPNTWLEVGAFSCAASAPNLPDISDKWGTISITGDNNLITQTFVPWNISKVSYVRHYRGGTWSDWDKGFTSNKVAFTPTPYSGYTIHVNDSYILNNIIFLNVTYKVNDTSVLPSNTNITFAKLPSNISPSSNPCLSGVAYDDSVKLGSCGANLSSALDIICTIAASNMKYVKVSGVIVI